uniref:Uncharacterized protein n=1 Tax=Syphacia muris TaxID=451379 RepID=A0A0N5AC03_9BILA
MIEERLRQRVNGTRTVTTEPEMPAGRLVVIVIARWQWDVALLMRIALRRSIIVRRSRTSTAALFSLPLLLPHPQPVLLVAFPLILSHPSIHSPFKV